MTQTSVFINTEKEFFHRYKDAPEEVWYLRNIHRHLLHIKVEVEVFSDDREIEFIMLKHNIDKYLSTMRYDENDSCEILGNMLLLYVLSEYGHERDIDITISEDGENGVCVTYRKE